MNIETQPSPDGEYFQHTIKGMAEAQPSSTFTDSLNDLERLQAGNSYPMVTAWKTEEGWQIEVSLWSENESPSAEEIASLNGTMSEVIASTKL